MLPMKDITRLLLRSCSDSSSPVTTPNCYSCCYFLSYPYSRWVLSSSCSTSSLHQPSSSTRIRLLLKLLLANHCYKVHVKPKTRKIEMTNVHQWDQPAAAAAHTHKSAQLLFLLLQAGNRRLFWVVGIGAETQLERETRRQQRLETDSIGRCNSGNNRRLQDIHHIKHGREENSVLLYRQPVVR